MQPGTLGQFIRENVIPSGMTVSEAARRLEVGRVALSNLLNGKASLSPRMALKLERAFGADSQALMRRQAEIKAVTQQQAESAAMAKRNAAGYLKITANEIAQWAAKSIEARSLLPVFIRRLVHATANQPIKVDFPGYEDSERPGWDGVVETKDASPWVPEAHSGWELSVSDDLPAKPIRDIRKRSELSNPEKARTTFIFVTARQWSGKDKWVAEQRATNEWRNVFAYDAHDLEQWLEQSSTTQIWFAERLGRPTNGVRSLDDCWAYWADATSPRLSSLLFAGAVSQHRRTLLNWIAAPEERPFVVVADSPAEALAFLACALREPDGSDNSTFTEAICVSTPEALRKVASASLNVILITENRDTELAATSLIRRQRVIIVRPRSSVEIAPDVAIEALDYETFRKALEDMGIVPEVVDRLRTESGLSLTILRRRLAIAPELKIPEWARDKSLVHKLVPLLLAGAWNRRIEADQILVSELTDHESGQVEGDLADLLTISDPPVWAIGNYRGLVSRKDAFFAVSDALQRSDLDRFFTVAELVLTEDDPSLDLPPEERWSAGIHGKIRQISGALRQSVGELLVLFAVYGDQLLGARLGPVSVRVDRLVLDLLKGSDARTWLTQRDDLALLGEASPTAFLDAIEADLKTDQPQLLAMLRPTGAGPFDSPDRSGLLWALETIAWNPDYFVCVMRILAQLSEIPIEDNWANKPENSLQSLIRSWMPQTAAGLDLRLKVLELVAQEFTEVGWRLCMSQVDNRHRFASANARPRWRTDAAGAGDVATGAEDYQMRREALDLLLAWPALDELKLGDLSEQVNDLPEKDQKKILARADEWLATEPSDAARANLRERIRRHTVTSRRHSKGGDWATAKQLAELSDRLAPNDPIALHQWLFADHYVPEARGEFEDESFNFEERKERIDAQRKAAIAEIFAVKSIVGIVKLLRGGNAWSAVGWHLAENVTEEAEQRTCVRALLDFPDNKSVREVDGCLEGFLRRLDDERREAVSRTLVANGENAIDDTATMRLFKASPCNRATWDLVQESRPDLVDRYWREVPPFDWVLPDADLEMMIDRLLMAERPLAAFTAVSHSFKNIEPDTLARLMKALPRATAQEAQTYRIDGYRIADALSQLDKTGTLSVAEMAQLEYLFVDALTFSEYGVPNLERQIEKSPSDFVHLVALLFRRADGGVDPPELVLPEGADKQVIGKNVYRVLEQIKRIPGTGEDGRINAAALIAWLKEARSRLATLARTEVGDSRIGDLLAKSPEGSDGVWPHEAVREALEAVGTEEMARGMQIGVHNSRGAVWRGPGGDQERALAAKYADFARRLELKYPITARMLVGIAASYEAEAGWHDTDEAVRKRLER